MTAHAQPQSEVLRRAIDLLRRGRAKIAAAAAEPLAAWLEVELHAAVYREEQWDRAESTRLRAQPFSIYYDTATLRALDVAAALLATGGGHG